MITLEWQFVRGVELFVCLLRLWYGSTVHEQDTTRVYANITDGRR